MLLSEFGQALPYMLFLSMPLYDLYAAPLGSGFGFYGGLWVLAMGVRRLFAVCCLALPNPCQGRAVALLGQEILQKGAAHTATAHDGQEGLLLSGRRC